MKKIKLESEDEGVGSVMGGDWRTLKTLFCMKVPSTAIREIALLKELRHPNIVNLKDILMQVRARENLIPPSVPRRQSCI